MILPQTTIEWVLWLYFLSVSVVGTVSEFLAATVSHKFILLSYSKFSKKGFLIVAEDYLNAPWLFPRLPYKWFFTGFYVPSFIVSIFQICINLDASPVILVANLMNVFHMSKRLLECLFVHHLTNKCGSVWVMFMVSHLYVCLFNGSIWLYTNYTSDEQLNTHHYVLVGLFLLFQSINFYFHVVLARLDRPNGQHFPLKKIGRAFAIFTMPNHLADFLAVCCMMAFAFSAWGLTGIVADGLYLAGRWMSTRKWYQDLAKEQDASSKERSSVEIQVIQAETDI